MNYSVNLVQRGIVAATHPVSGKSGKLYGNAFLSPEHGGAVFQMSLDDYHANSHDIVGNTTPGQQWVPEFSVIGVNKAIGKCDRCSRDAVARWDRFLFCDEHAPKNAVYQDGTGETVEQRHRRQSGATAPAPAPVHVAPAPAAADVPPVVEERLSGPIEEERELPQENLRAPVIGTEKEDSPPEKVVSGVVVLPPPKLDPGEAPPPAPEPQRGDSVTQPPAAQPPKKSALEAITEAVIDGVVPQLMAAIDEKFAQLKPSPAPEPPKETPVPRPAAKAKSAPKTKARPESEFSQLQKRAKELGINSYGKSGEKLRSEIAAKEKPAEKPEEEEIPF